MDSFGDLPKKYGMAGSAEGIPDIFNSSKEPRPLWSQTRLVSVVSQSGNQPAAGRVVFQVPNGSNSYIKPNSMYFKFDVIATGGDAATRSKFQGPVGSAASVIQRSTISYGSVQLDQLTNYNVWHDSMVSHASSSGYINNDLKVLTRQSLVGAVPAAATTNNCIVPVINGSVNSRAIPQFLMTSPILVEFDLATAAEAFSQTADGATPISGFTVSNTALYYEQIAVDAAYVQAVKSQMVQGALWQSCINNVSSFQLGAAASINYAMGVNLNSVRGVFWTQRIPYSVLTAASPSLYKSNAINTARLYIDSRLVNQYNLDNSGSQYAEMNRSLSNLFDTNITSGLVGTTDVLLGLPLTRALYESNIYLGGINLNRFNDPNLIMCGTPAQQLQLELVQTIVAGDIQHIFVVYDSILMLDGTGTMQIVK